VLADAAGLVRERLGRIQERVEVVRPADCGHLGAVHGRVPLRTPNVILERARRAVAVARVVVSATRRRIAVDQEPPREGRSRERSRGSEQLSSGEAGFRHG
jgi:hypothetical protein